MSNFFLGGSKTENEIDISGKADLSYVDSQLSTKIGITDLNSRGLYFDTNKVGIGATPSSDEKLQVNGAITCTQLVLNSQDLNGLLNTKLGLSGGTMTGNISLGTNKITSSSTASASTDIPNKSYVDSADNLKLNLSGGTMTGNISLGTNKITSSFTASASTDIPNKSYVDTALNSKLNTSGGSITGNINMNNQNITALYNLDVTNNVTVAGNLTVNGSTSYLNTTNLAISDPLTRVADTNPADIIDIGMYGKYVSSGTKYTGIFRDATDNKYKYFHGLTEEPTNTVNIVGTGYTKSDIVVGGIDTTGITLGGTTITATGGDINKIAGVIDGAGNASKALVLDANSDISQIRNVSLSGSLSTGIITYPTAIFLKSPSIEIQDVNNNTHVTFFTDSTYAGFITRPNAQYTISHATNSTVQDLIIHKTGSNTSRLYLQSDGTSTDSIYLYSLSGGITLNCPSPSGQIMIKCLYGSTTIECPLLTRGVGVDSNGVVSASITNGAANSIGTSTRVVNITTNSGAGVLYSIPPAVSLLNYQQIIVHNNTSTLITLGRAVSSAGFIDCPIAVLLHPGEFIQLLYNTSLTKWMMDSSSIHIPDGVWRAHRWTNDDLLSIFLNTTYTYQSKVNFNSATSTINGVSGIENVNASTFTFTGGSLSGAPTNNASYLYELTSTESNKFKHSVYGMGGKTITFTSLTPGNYYELCLYLLDVDGTGPGRVFSIKDDQTKYESILANFPFSSGSANSPACIYSYIFRFKGRHTSNYTFSITDSTNSLFGGMTLRNIGATL